MRLKTFTAPTIDAAKAKIRKSLGEQAIIAHIHDRGEQGVEIVCAIEPDPEQEKLAHSERPAPPRQINEISRALRWHQWPLDLADRLLHSLATSRGRETTRDSLTIALEALFRFEPLFDAETIKNAWPLILFGPPGRGKTVTAAKIALKARLQGITPVLICADYLRTGAAEQLELYAEKLNCAIYHAGAPDKLEKILAHLKKGELPIIDTPGINPFARNDMTLLKKLTALKGARPVLVLDTTLDAIAGTDLTRAFSSISARHLLFTSMDIDRRLGRILSIAEAGGFALCCYSPRPVLVDGLIDCNAPVLSELLLSDIPAGLKSGHHIADIQLQENLSPEESGAIKTVKEGKAKPKKAPANQKQENKPAQPIMSAELPETIPNMLAVASGKGGVGKTFLSATLAHALALKGRKILLFDGDLGLANIDIQLGLTPQNDLGKVLAGKVSIEEAITPVEEAGFDVIAGRSGSGRLASLPLGDISALWDQMGPIAQRYDHILLDLGAGIDRINQFLTGRAGVVFVITNEEPTALTDAYAFLKIIYRQNPQALQYVVINSASSERQGEHTFRLLEQTCLNFLNLTPKLAGIVRQDKHVHNAIRSQKPFLIRWPQSDAAKDIIKLAQMVSTFSDGKKPAS